MSAFFTKSLFSLALSCPTKLYYTSHKEYSNQNLDNDFLEALAKGGFQVGALAKCYFPKGHDIKTLDIKEAVHQTEQLLKLEDVIIFEAAIQVDKFLIRVDILEKKGSKINLIEVKAKSFGGNSSLDMLNASGNIDSGWKPYLYDVAFQKYVLQLAMPESEIVAHLMLADKTQKASVNGLNQMFIIKNDKNGNSYVESADLSVDDLGEPILTQVNVNDLCNIIHKSDSTILSGKSFVEATQYLASSYMENKKIVSNIGMACSSCEFKATSNDENIGILSGFKECWKHHLGWLDDNFSKPLIFDIWNFRGKKKLLDRGIYHLTEVSESDIGVSEVTPSGKLKTKERQWLQVKETVSDNPQPYIDLAGLKEEMDKWIFPLHMIDFETSAVAVPFYKGRKPYEQTAFQFSHHIIYKDGTIKHQGEFLNTQPGVFPNYEFARELKWQLEEDEGSVFRYAAHENTILNHIIIQLNDESIEDVPDKYELIDFLKSITHSANHQGDRDMIDLLELVKGYYWHPSMGGSNSIKQVLPAVLNSSDYIKSKYTQPIYGKNSLIPSLNFNEGWQWIKFDNNGNVISPYKLLPALFNYVDKIALEHCLTSEKLADGGAAMTAYAMMQFTQMSEIERQSVANGLLRYCELDTMAMVFIWEHWNNLISQV